LAGTESKSNLSRRAWRREIETQVRVAKSDSDDKMYICLYINKETSMATTKVSVAEARQNFARLIKRAQQGKAIEITRRGEPVAVLISASEYSAITGQRSSFIDAMSPVRERLRVADLGIGDAEFEGLREESPGREISL
jgi:prevent-host-death family protein